MKKVLPLLRQKVLGVLASFAIILLPTFVQAQQNNYGKIFDGYTKVVSTADGKEPLYEIWINKKTNEMLAQLPKDYAKKKFFVALTVSSGERFAGLHAGELYVYWKKIGDRLALIEPNVETRSTGDRESKSSVERLFTDRVILDLPILATSPKGEPVIDMDELLVKNAPKFFGMSGRTGNVAGFDMGAVLRLKEIKEAKAFPENVELAYQVPMNGGRLKTLHYSFSEIPDNTGYRPRKADDRVGYFTTGYDDLGKFKRGETRVRYINRWHLEKADPSLKVSPPKKPIVFYIEHSTPIRYRRFVKEGVLYWNRAFEQVGIAGAIEVYYQDATTGAHMDKDPEDVRYNFLRWLNNDISTAIGPSRVHPLTGQILDADIILTDGWIRVFEQQFSKLLPKLAMEGFSPETYAWLERHPEWDPRIQLAPTHERNMMLRQRAIEGAQPLGGHEFARMAGTNQSGELSTANQMNGFCNAAFGKALDLTMLRMTLDMLANEGEGAESKDDTLDGIPAPFIGPLLADLVAHEVGHTLGLRHNFKASSLYSLKEINSNKVKGKAPFTASVMDYNPININMKDGEVQGDFAMIDIGPYDLWAIEFGYTMDEKELPKILARCTEKELQYLTDQDTAGPDPFARRYDFTSDPIDYAKNQMKLAKYHRDRLLTKFVKDGDSWSEARRGYDMTLSMQTRSLSMMANWIGGAYVRRDHKGDKGNRAPVEPVEASKQRAAIKWIMENSFRDESFGLTAELLQRMRTDFLASDESFSSAGEAVFPVHDRVMGIQSSVLTMMMNPSTLRRVYDNELIVESNKDALTLPEMLNTVQDEVFSELAEKANGKFTARKPMITSLRRNLQREFIERLIDLTNSGGSNPAAIKPISTLARLQLRQLSTKLANAIKANEGNLDPYTLAHLQDAQNRVTKALEAQYTIGANRSSGMSFLIGRPAAAVHCTNANCPHCQTSTTGSWSSERQGR